MSATATTTTADQCLAPGRVEDSAPGARYRRLFDRLPPLEVDEGALHWLGRADGPCDDSAVGGSADANVAAGWPFFGQFVAHDITADRSPIGHRTDPGQIRNFRTPRANLEGVYGSGPVGSPYLYDKDDPVKLLLGEGGHDVPRNHQGIALLGDQRNDVHLFVSQMQVAFIRTHNRIVDRLRADGVDEGDVFEEARRTATWHYQWVILNEVPAAPGRPGPGRRAARGRLVAAAARGGALHPVRVRRRRIPLRPQPDSRHLSRQPGFRPGAGVPRPDGLRRRAFGPHHRLDAPVRPARERIGAAVQEDRRHAYSLPDRHAAPGHRRGGGLGLLLTCHTRPPARPGGRARVRRGGRARDGRRASVGGPDRAG